MTQPPIDREALVRRFVDGRTLALLLVGSHARGEAGPMSDIDLARAFSWEPLAAAADRHVAGEVAHLAEEALKIAAGVTKGRASQILYGTLGMTVNLAEAMVVYRRGFIDSENRLFDIALEAMAAEPAWQGAFRIAAGYDAAAPEEKGRAALVLYGETARLVATLLSDEQWAVVGTGLKAASQALNRSLGLPIS